MVLFSTTGSDLRPKRSKLMENASQGSVNGRRGNRHGCSTERIRCVPILNEEDFRIRTTSRRDLPSRESFVRNDPKEAPTFSSLPLAMKPSY